MDPCRVLLSRGVFQTLDTPIELQDLICSGHIQTETRCGGGCGCVFQFKKDVRHTWQARHRTQSVVQNRGGLQTSPHMPGFGIQDFQTVGLLLALAYLVNPILVSFLPNYLEIFFRLNAT